VPTLAFLYYGEAAGWSSNPRSVVVPGSNLVWARALRVTLLDRGGIYHVRNESLQFLLGIVLQSGSGNRVSEEIVVSHKSISKKRRYKDERG
jgi:hypothetical protein